MWKGLISNNQPRVKLRRVIVSAHIGVNWKSKFNKIKKIEFINNFGSLEKELSLRRRLFSKRILKSWINIRK